MSLSTSGELAKSAPRPKNNLLKNEDRIKQRGTESKAQVLKRIGLDRVLFINHGDMFDFVIISGDGNENGVAQ